MTVPEITEHAYFWALDPSYDDWLAAWPTLRGDAQHILTLAEEQGILSAELIELGDSDHIDLSTTSGEGAEEFLLFGGTIGPNDYDAETRARYRYHGYLSFGATSASPIAAATLLRAKVLAPDAISIHAAPAAWGTALDLYNAAFGTRPDVGELCDPGVWTNGPAKHRAPVVPEPENKPEGITGGELLSGGAAIGALIAVPIMIFLGWLHRSVTPKAPAPDFFTTWACTMSMCLLGVLCYMAYDTARRGRRRVRAGRGKK